MQLMLPDQPPAPASPYLATLIVSLDYCGAMTRTQHINTELGT